MSEFDDFFTLTEDKNKKEPKKPRKPEKKKKKSEPRSTTKKSPKTTKIDETKLSSVITKEDLQTLKNDLLASLKETSGLQSHIFNRENLISFIGRRGSRGTKLCELRDFFYPTPVGEIDKKVQKLHKEGLIKKNRSGWMSLTKKTH